ncbi:MAG: DNA-dependent ATPase MCM [Candidatus Syntrophoarchaeum caldarius]|uniref:DNA-dependent ATPase MCM n=1 Tax=Candidatus Syntropharchaeum caldarium TaxID=1838285 RepID=A0A1F2PAL7_9EURY|nr:MAG: DNA-dependent ATPase MCM [Candidatus Syntrophoarchaeum caldarius]
MDLSTINISTKDRELLKKNGIRTVEALAILTPGELPFGKQKASAMIQNARNVIASNNIEAIEIEDEEVRVICSELDPVIEASIKAVLGLDNPHNLIEVEDKEFLITPKWGAELTWRRLVLPQIVKWKYVLDSSKEELLKENSGLSLDPSAIIDFAKSKGFDGFCRDVFEDIKGNEIMKMAITTALFSTFDEPVHIAIVGPPASSKTLAREIISDNISSVERIGGNSTRAGLVINYSTGELGSIAYADERLVLADEFDKVPKGDIEMIYELMSNGTCDVHSGRVHRTIRSKFIMIATMNPRRDVFSANAIEDIGLPPTLASRFALIVKTDDLGKPDRLDLFKKKFYTGNELKKFSLYFDEWVKLARTHEPGIVASNVDEYLEKINEIVEEFGSSPLRRDNRMGEYARNIAFAIARSEFTDVDDRVLDKALEIIEGSVREWL